MTKLKPVVLSQSDQAFFEKAGGKRWMRRKLFHEGPQMRYQRALTAFADELEGLKLEPHNQDSLTEMLAVLLSKDGTFGAWFRDHNFPVQDADQFERLCRTCAGELVREYLHKAEQRSVDSGLTGVSEVQAGALDLIKFAIEQGEISAAEGRAANEDWWQMTDGPDFVATAEKRLLEILLAEETVLHDVAEYQDVPAVPNDEREREIAKSALLQLKITQLRKVAEDNDLVVLRDPEALAELVANYYQASRAEIAEVVLKYSKPDVERGWATRIVPLVEAPDLEIAQTVAASLGGKYLRLDVATWFVTKNVNTSLQTLVLGGDIRFYSVRPQREGEAFDIAAQQRQHPTTLRLRAGQKWAEVDGQSSTDVKRLRTLMRRAFAVRTAEVHLDVPALSGPEAQWDRSTVRFLHALEHGLRDEHLDYVSFLQAEFTKFTGAQLEPQQVAVRAVRLQGQHVMDDPAACRYISGGQILGSVDIRVKWTEVAGGDAFFATVRIGMAQDHAYVLTAIGDDKHASKALHNDLVKKLRLALEASIDKQALSEMVTNILDRADQAKPPDTVDIWAPAAPARAVIAIDARPEAPSTASKEDHSKSR